MVNATTSNTGGELCIAMFTNAGNTSSPQAVVWAVLAQLVWASAFWGVFFPKFLSKALAEDKGVKSARFFILRYPTPSVPLFVSSIAAAIRYLAVVGVVTLIGGTSLCLYLQAGLFVGCLFVVAAHHKFWAQQPLTLISLELLSDITSALLASWVAYSMQ